MLPEATDPLNVPVLELMEVELSVDKFPIGDVMEVEAVKLLAFTEVVVIDPVVNVPVNDPVLEFIVVVFPVLAVITSNTPLLTNGMEAEPVTTKSTISALFACNLSSTT